MNKAILIGNLERDPETSNKNGMIVAKFSIATSEKWKDKNTGEMQERTEWHRIRIR
jgi:single-strand DNA-binding protein